jgi:hypothetical protein
MNPPIISKIMTIEIAKVLRYWHMPVVIPFDLQPSAKFSRLSKTKKSMKTDMNIVNMPMAMV